jgi:hypothetical protein
MGSTDACIVTLAVSAIPMFSSGLLFGVLDSEHVRSLWLVDGFESYSGCFLAERLFHKNYIKD